MYRHERSLVAKYRDRPFVLLGINSDRDRQVAQEAIDRHGINWRSWWDGDRQIASEWRVEMWPTIYLIDAKGTIRFVQVRGDQLERAIDTLLAEMEGSASSSWLRYMSPQWLMGK